VNPSRILESGLLPSQISGSISIATVQNGFPARPQREQRRGVTFSPARPELPEQLFTRVPYVEPLSDARTKLLGKRASRVIDCKAIGGSGGWKQSPGWVGETKFSTVEGSCAGESRYVRRL